MRLEMDRLNERLLRLIESRAQLALRIGRAKAKRALPAADPAREREMLAHLTRSGSSTLPRAELVRIFRAVFAASRRAVIRDRGEKTRQR